ncbi:nicotinamide N-methyltransferase-like [Myripristis murdjan]|uniref:nicotinamide N-methyltransferase-like n=1 Tax=Myripristis murdjan TaxID=586833 RepID=UPI0011762B02|nr:nicotinamide N-methyltransferase-like [Myripristis murdjan]
MEDLYETKFDPETYLNEFYLMTGKNRRFASFMLCQLSQTFSSGKYKGKRLIEIGTGPTIHTLISASAHFEEIVVSDYAEVNRREVEKWLRDEEGCFNWNRHIQFACDVEGRRTPAVVKETLRQKIKHVLKCDVNLENPFQPLTVEPADCIISSLCLEAACKDREAYRRSLEAVVGLLQPGGVLVMIGDLSETFYTVGDQRFPVVSLSQEFIEDTLCELGMSVQHFNRQKLTNTEDRSDIEANFYLVAHKE